MSNMNVVILTGNLTRDPECNYAGNVADRAKFSIAVNRKWTDRASGQAKEETAFLECTAWKATANVIAQYCKKGSKVAIHGELSFEQWTANDGGKRSKLTVTVHQVELLSPQQQSGPGTHGHYQQPSQQQAPATQPQQQYIDPNSEAAPF